MKALGCSEMEKESLNGASVETYAGTWECYSLYNLIASNVTEKYLAAVLVWPYLNNEVFIDKHKLHSRRVVHRGKVRSGMW